MRRFLAICLALSATGAHVSAQEGHTASSMQASIAGAVFDSISLRPMAGAVVQLAQLSGTGRVERTWSAATDSAGRYVFEGLPFGTYLVGFQHLAMDTLGFHSPVHRVDVRRAGVLRVMFGVPSMRSIVRKVCGEQSAEDSVSLLVGSVRHATSDAAIAAAYVSVKWAEVFITRTGMVRETPTHDLRTNDDGWYMACVPSGIPVTAHAEHDALRSGDVQVVMSTLAVLRRDLYIGAAERVIVTANDSVRASGAVNPGDRVVASGNGTVRGTVRGLDGAPVVDARVSVASARGESRTDAQGRFTLRSVPEGTHMVEVRALGFVPGEALVDIVAFRDADVQVTLFDLAGTLLDTVRVRGVQQMSAAMVAGFERRRRSGVGTFLDENVFDTLKVNTFSDIVRRIPGITFQEGRGSNDVFERQMYFTGSGRSQPCTPDIFLDGLKLLPGVTDLDQLVNPATIRRLEVYMRGTTPPAEFVSNARCGVLAVWTSRRAPAPRRGS
ncbi:MAG: carboxypeptidase regulatory-like domain-containing protein [Gemmatimonadaceae bacterium]